MNILDNLGKLTGITAFILGIVILLGITQVHSKADAMVRSTIAIKNNLIDPDSAKIKDVEVFVFEDGHFITICGQVNAKNKFGGYVGFRPFIYREAYEEPYVVRIVEDDDSVFNAYIKKACLEDKLKAARP